MYEFKYLAELYAELLPLLSLSNLGEPSGDCPYMLLLLYNLGGRGDPPLEPCLDPPLEPLREWCP